MFYYMTKYSFDAHKVVTGPFATEEEAWAAMEKDAFNELMISKKESSANIDYMVYEAEKEIVIVDHFKYYDHTTEWFVFQI